MSPKATHVGFLHVQPLRQPRPPRAAPALAPSTAAAAAVDAAAAAAGAAAARVGQRAQQRPQAGCAPLAQHLARPRPACVDMSTLLTSLRVF